MSISKTVGLVAAPPTGFQEDGTVDFAVVRPLARHMEALGVSGVFINGTTGEGLLLSVEERIALAQEWRRALTDRIRMFVHVGHDSLEEARRMARHAQAIGADAVACLAPPFCPPGAIEPLVAWCEAIASAAPRLPFYYYHIPSQNNVHLSVANFMGAAGNRIPNFAGAKFTFEALDDYLESLCLAGERYDVLWGRDEMLLSALAVGARGAVGSTYTVVASLYHQLWDAFTKNDLNRARSLQWRAISLIRTMKTFGNFFSVLKAILRIQGVPISPRTRLPLTSISPDQVEMVGRRCLAILEEE